MSSRARDLVLPRVSNAAAAFEAPEEFDDYVIRRRLGQGATGQVYLAEDTVLARPIAIKFIGTAPEPVARQRFLREARAAARIQHPNVVSIYRVGELGDRPYIVSELVRGTALSDVARPMPWAKALAVAIDLDLSRELVGEHPQVRVVFMSGYHGASPLPDWQFIAKPFDRQILLAKIGHVQPGGAPPAP